MTAERVRWLALLALVAIACDAPVARDAGVRRVVPRPAPRTQPAPVAEPPAEPPFDFRLAEWMPEVYIDSTRHCRMVAFEAQRRRSIADCTTGTWARGALAWDHTTRIELRATDDEIAVLEREQPAVGCARDVRVRILESPRRMVRAVLVDLGAPFGCRHRAPRDPHYEIARDPAASDLSHAEENSVAVCYIAAVHGVEREGDDLIADLSCRHGERTTRASVYTTLSHTDDVARLAPARIAEIRVDGAFGDGVEGELVSVLDAPWFDPRSAPEATP